MPRMYATHADKLRAYRERDRARHNEKRRIWALENPEKVAASQRKWAAKNPDKVRVYWTRKDARRRNAEGKFSDEDVARILTQQNGKCACCKAPLRGKYEIDHIRPLAKGGSNYPNNLQILCRRCNRSKGCKDPNEFMRSNGFLI